MKILERERRWGMEVVLFLAALVLCVVTGINFIKREDNEHHRIEAVENSIGDITERQNAILEKFDKLNVVKPEPTPTNVNVSFSKPIEVTVIEKPKPDLARTKNGAYIPEVPPQFTGKKGQKMKMGILIKRANMPPSKTND